MARTLKPEKLDVRRNERAAFIGATGTGKTTLAKSILWGMPHVVVLDPKHTFALPGSWPGGFRTTGKRAEVESFDGVGTLIYRPTPDELTKAEHLDWFFWWVFDRGNTLCYIDETYMIADGTNPGRWHMACITLGRERGIGVWHATQRPVRMPVICVSEAEHVFVFRLRNKADRDRVADYTVDEIGARNPTGNAFWYWSDPAQKLRYFERANVGGILGR